MGIRDHILGVFETTGNSFVIGGAASLVNNALRRGGKWGYSNSVTKRLVVEQPLRNGGELAKYSMIYAVFYHGLNAVGASGWTRSLGSAFVASFVCGLRNGRSFGLRSGVRGMMNSLIYEMINKVEGS